MEDDQFKSSRWRIKGPLHWGSFIPRPWSTPESQGPGPKGSRFSQLVFKSPRFPMQPMGGFCPPHPPPGWCCRHKYSVTATLPLVSRYHAFSESPQSLPQDISFLIKDQKSGYQVARASKHTPEFLLFVSGTTEYAAVRCPVCAKH